MDDDRAMMSTAICTGGMPNEDGMNNMEWIQGTYGSAYVTSNSRG